jgi:hypothetical protein
MDMQFSSKVAVHTLRSIMHFGLVATIGCTAASAGHASICLKRTAQSRRWPMDIASAARPVIRDIRCVCELEGMAKDQTADISAVAEAHCP